MMKVLLVGCFLLALPTNYDGGVQAQTQDKPQLTVKLIDDFQVTGAGDHASWRQAEWTSLRRRQADGHPYDARFKVLYSKTGLYFLMEGTDKKLTAAMSEDYMDLWKEDVFEVFLWPDERYPVYFEYRDLAPQSRAADPYSQFRRAVPRLATVALRGRSSDPQGDERHRRPETVTGGNRGVARGIHDPLHGAAPSAECAAEARHDMARELLPHGSRRWERDAVGVGVGGPELPRVPRSSVACCLRIGRLCLARVGRGLSASARNEVRRASARPRRSLGGGGTPPPYIQESRL